MNAQEAINNNRKLPFVEVSKKLAEPQNPKDSNVMFLTEL